MFVRWKTRPRRRGRRTRAAQLVESIRVDGRPRQKVRLHIASCRVGGERRYWCRKDFWDVADRNLARFGLDPATCARVAAALATVVPRPDADSAQDPVALLGHVARRFRKLAF